MKNFINLKYLPLALTILFSVSCNLWAHNKDNNNYSYVFTGHESFAAINDGAAFSIKYPSSFPVL